jgi:hypothetical protein
MTQPSMRWMDLWRTQNFKALREYRSGTGLDQGYAWDPDSLLFVARKWHLAGSEVATQRWAADLARRGWRTAFADVRGLSNMNEEQLWSYAAVVLATGAGHLGARRIYGYGCYGPRLVGMLHTSPSDDDPNRVSDLQVVNTDHERNKYPCINPITLHPPVYRFFDTHVKNGADAIVQVNLDKRLKNPQIFYYLAQRFPSRRFIGIKGVYGEQVVCSPGQYPNVEIWEPSVDAVQRALAEAWCLIMPSRAESYGMAAAEAISVGVPVIVSEPTTAFPNVAGLREAVGLSGIYVDPSVPESWAAAITHLTEHREARLTATRECARQGMAREGAELVAVNEALKALVQTRQG